MHPLPVPEKILLTGYMGAGKSTVGRLLASRLKYRFVDTDQELVRRFGRTVSEIFKTQGEAAFREAELTLLAELLENSWIIISTGGGTLTREETLSLAEQKGWIVYLRAPVDLLYERVVFSPKDRPMIDVPDAEAAFRERFCQREPFYNRAHLTVDSEGKKADLVVSEILTAFKLKETAP